MGRWYNRPKRRPTWAVQLNGGPYAGPCDLTAEHVAALAADPADTTIVSAQGVVYEFDHADYVKHILHYRHHTHEEPTMPTPDPTFNDRVIEAIGDMAGDWLESLWTPLPGSTPRIALDLHGLQRFTVSVGLMLALSSMSETISDEVVRQLEELGFTDMVPLVRSARAAYRMAEEGDQ